jgi:hypothetical protein
LEAVPATQVHLNTLSSIPNPTARLQSVTCGGQDFFIMLLHVAVS